MAGEIPWNVLKIAYQFTEHSRKIFSTTVNTFHFLEIDWIHLRKSELHGITKRFRKFFQVLKKYINFNI